MFLEDGLVQSDDDDSGREISVNSFIKTTDLVKLL